jgi:hypothetical protein
MKHLLYISFVAACVLIACQKSINWNLDAVASLAKDSSDNCLPISVYGSYQVKSPLNDSNYVVVSVNVDSPGDYNIYTNIVNGYSFKASGTFATKGLTDVKLMGSGTPLDIGVNDFIVHLNFSSCSFSITVPSDTSGPDNTDTVYAGTSGTLASEIQTSTASYFTWYDSTGTKMTEISSDNQPFRKIFYNALNKIDKIDFYSGSNSSYTFDHTEKYIYDNNNNVTAILQYSQDGILEDSLSAFEYDASDNIVKKTQYSGGSIDDVKSYSYDASGNLIKVYTLSGNVVADSVTVQYDSRQNNFKQIYPQYDFLDPLISSGGNENEIFYYSANYPVLIIHADGTQQTITVDTNTNGKPADIKFDGNTTFAYSYN